MQFLLLLTVLPALALGFKCSFPQQWRGILFFDYNNGPSAQSQGGHSEGSEMVTYDNTVKRVVVNQTININGMGDYQQVVYQDLNTGEQWVVAGGKCTYMNITVYVPMDGIPNDAAVLRKSYMGAGSSKIDTTMYHFMYKQSQNAYMTVADDGCIPIIYESVGMAGLESFKLAAQYTNMTASNIDASYFNPPSMCMQGHQ